MTGNLSGYQRSANFNKNTIGYANKILNKLPWGIQVMDNIAELNPKYEKFSELIPSRDERLARMSVFNAGYGPDGQDVCGLGNLVGDQRFQAFMYSNLDMDKIRRLSEYRQMSNYPTIADCLDEISDELLFENDNCFVKLKLDGVKDKLVKSAIEDEWKKFVDIFELKEKGWERFRKFLIDGELFFENIISENRPDLGIVGLVEIPTELISPVYDNIQNNKIANYIMRRPVLDELTQKIDHEDTIAMDRNQITYISSGLKNEDGTIVLPYIENARRAYKQMSMIEDSLIIYRLTRTPEKLVFKINTGNMTPPNAEAYLRRLQSQYWTRKTFDPQSGRATNMFDPQSATDSYWFPIREGVQASEVQNLTTSAKFGEMDDLLYFQQQLYRAMHVPTERLKPDAKHADGAESSREEIRFGKYLRRIQQRFAMGMKETFITHLKLRGFWNSFNLHVYDFDIRFNVSSIFEETKKQQYLDLKINNFNQLSQNDGISNTFCQKKYLGWSDDDIKANQEWKKIDAIHAWELQKLSEQGPNWKKAYEKEQNMEEDLMNEIAGVGEPVPGAAPGMEGGAPPMDMGAGAQPAAPAESGAEAAPAAPPAGTAALPPPMGPSA